jgi:hypothetical protein
VSCSLAWVVEDVVEQPLYPAAVAARYGAITSRSWATMTVPEKRFFTAFTISVSVDDPAATVVRADQRLGTGLAR